MTSVSLGTGAVRKFRPERAGRQSEDAGIEVRLLKGSIWWGKAGGRCRAIKCLEGKAWITQERDYQDYIICAGETFPVSQPGKVVVQAMLDTSVEIVPCVAARR